MSSVPALSRAEKHLLFTTGNKFLKLLKYHYAKDNNHPFNETIL